MDLDIINFYKTTKLIFFVPKLKQKKILSGTRTRNLMIRSHARYPLRHKDKCSYWGSNPRPSAHKTDALPTEL